MTDVDVLQKALEKARDNGWSALKSQSIRCYKDGTALMVEFFMGVSAPSRSVNYEHIIFSHEWAVVRPINWPGRYVRILLLLCSSTENLVHQIG
jgi:hypothetical protein